MASNVIAMKYPFSDTGRWSYGEVRGIDPEKACLSKEARKQSAAQAPDVGRSDSGMALVRSLDLRIAKLMSERECAAEDMKWASLDAVREAFGFDYDSAAKIASEFERHGFSSPLARKAVKVVRDLLFDDSDGRFRDVLCTEIRYGGDEDELMFCFEHEPTGKCFRIDVPASYDRRKRIAAADAYFSNRHRRTDSGWAQVYGVGIVCAINHSCEGAIAYHYDLRVVREQLRLFAERNFDPIVGKRDKDMYVKYYADNRGAEMSMHDYYREAEG